MKTFYLCWKHYLLHLTVRYISSCRQTDIKTCWASSNHQLVPLNAASTERADENLIFKNHCSIRTIRQRITYVLIPSKTEKLHFPLQMCWIFSRERKYWSEIAILSSDPGFLGGKFIPAILDIWETAVLNLENPGSHRKRELNYPDKKV